MQQAWRAYHADHSANTTFQIKISPKAKSLYSWIDLIVNGNNSLSISCNKLYQKYICLNPIDCCMLHKYIIMLVDLVGEKIKDKIQKENCIADGWTQTGVHYIAVYHCWPILEKDGSIKNLTALLAIQPLLDETDLSSVSFSEFIAATYSLYLSDEKISDTTSHNSHNSPMDELDLIVALTLDNCSTNKATVQQLEKPMIGAECHHLNLAAAHWTKDAFEGKLQSTLDNIHVVMKQASMIKNCARLQHETTYQPYIRNKTHWQGNNPMAVQYA